MLIFRLCKMSFVKLSFVKSCLLNTYSNKLWCWVAKFKCAPEMICFHLKATRPLVTRESCNCLSLICKTHTTGWHQLLFHELGLPLPRKISYNLLFQISQLHQIWSRWIEHDMYDDCISLPNFSIWIDKTFIPLRISLTTFLSSYLRLILEGHV